MKKRSNLRQVAPLFALLVGSVSVGCALDSGGTSLVDVAEAPLAVGGVTFKTAVVPRFLGATSNGGSTVVATATVAQAWETFTLDDLNGGTLNSGDAVTIRTGGSRYFRAVNGGGAALDATATTPQGWETFTLVRNSGSGSIKNGDIVALRASNGRYVRAVNGGGAGVDVQGAAVSTWEQFVIGGLAQAPSGDPTCATGIKNGDACCPAACGACGGSGCGSRPGGTAACCTGPIVSAGVSCSGAKPPCVLGTTSTPPTTPPSDGLVWRKATLTNYTSYPDPGSEECLEYNGCTWAGYFAALSGKQPESWVKANNIIAVHSKDFEKYKLKTVRLRQGTKSIDAKVYDMCADSDCDGCCTRNAQPSGYLVDVEKYTMERFGTGSGQVEWACLDCGSNP